MIKFTDILTEILNTYEVDVIIKSNKNQNISDILDQIRALRKITTVRNITPPDYPQKENIEYTRVNIKFLSKTGKPEEDIKEFEQEKSQQGFPYWLTRKLERIFFFVVSGIIIV